MKKAKVLLVDDEVAFTKSLLKLLSAKGYFVKAADNDGLVVGRGGVGQPHDIADDQGLVGVVFQMFGPVRGQGYYVDLGPLPPGLLQDSGHIG